jgi:protein-tyrosine phosphatase
MSGYVDLHLHYVPFVDDGVRTIEDGITLCRELTSLGFSHLVTTPHIRSGMFDNTRAGLTAAFDSFRARALEVGGLPQLSLSAEHHVDGVFLELLHAGELLPFPGGKALLVEFAHDVLPVAFEQLVFKLGLKGLRPILAHPERYAPLFKRTTPIERFLDQDLGLQLDLMSLVGKYGRAAKRAAERMLEEGVYTIAASDAHRPEDAPRVADALERLKRLVGPDETQILLRDNPSRLLAGEATL